MQPVSYQTITWKKASSTTRKAFIGTTHWYVRKRSNGWYDISKSNPGVLAGTTSVAIAQGQQEAFKLAQWYAKNSSY